MPYAVPHELRFAEGCHNKGTRRYVLSRTFRMALVGGLVAGAAVLTVAVATAGVTHKKAGADVCFLLPDTKTSIRWEQFDRPAMAKALKAALDTQTK